MKILQGLRMLGRPFAKRLVSRLAPNAADPLHDPHRQRGVTMIEAMLGLAVIAAVTVGGIITYNAVAVRVEANNIASGLQAFMSDTLQYLNNYHTEQPGGLPETTAQGKTVKEWQSAGGTAGTAAIPPINPGCTNAGTPHSFCIGSGDPATIPNPNALRFANIPSLRHGDGNYDEDAHAEWHIPYGSNSAVEISFSIIPTHSATGPAPTGNFGAATEWANCASSDGVGPDTAVAARLAIESKEVCDNLAQQLSRYDHVNAAYCLDDETSPVASELAQIEPGHIPLYLCLSVMR